MWPKRQGQVKHAEECAFLEIEGQNPTPVTQQQRQSEPEGYLQHYA